MNKVKFKISDDLQITLNKLIEEYNIINLNDFQSNFNKILTIIDSKQKKQFLNLIIKLINEFLDLEFENSQKDYEIIKHITFIFLVLYSQKLDFHFFSVYLNFIGLLNSIINLNYIDRIKVLITFIKKTFESIKEEITENKITYKITHEWLNFCNIDDDESCQNYPFVKEAFDTFYRIIDDLEEDCPFFQAILQFNSIIYKDSISEEPIHSGSILNVNDIKLELIKNINRFIFLSEREEKDLDNLANFDDTNYMVTINLLTFFESKSDIKEKRYHKKAASVVLFLLFHELFYNQKKNINNEAIDIPRTHFDYNLNFFSIDGIDTGMTIWKLLLGKVNDLEIFMKSDSAEKLL